MGGKGKRMKKAKHKNEPQKPFFFFSSDWTNDHKGKGENDQRETKAKGGRRGGVHPVDENDQDLTKGFKLKRRCHLGRSRSKMNTNEKKKKRKHKKKEEGRRDEIKRSR